MKKDFKPYFIGIGVAKAGSSMLSDLMAQHPELAMSKTKEINYFNKTLIDGSPNPQYSKSPDFYFNNWSSKDRLGKKCGEYSPMYFGDSCAPQGINNYCPDSRKIVILRNPVERAFSHFIYRQQFVRAIDIKLSFLEAINKHKYLLHNGLYAYHLNRWFNEMSTDQFLVLFLEDFKADALKEQAKLWRFLEVEDIYLSPEKINESKKVSYPFFDEVLKTPGKIKRVIERSNPVFKRWADQFSESELFVKLSSLKENIISANAEKFEKPEMDKEARHFLEDYYHQDSEKLKSLLNLNKLPWE